MIYTYFYYDYGLEISNAINDAFISEGLEPEVTIPAEGEGVGMWTESSYDSGIKSDGSIKFWYNSRNWSCEIVFAFTQEGCIIDSIEVDVHKK